MPKEKTKKVKSKSYISKAVKFSKILKMQFPDIVKGILLFGSAAKGKKVTGDIDILVILDDTSQKTTEEQLERIDEHIRLIAEQIGELHPQIHTLTDFWDWIRHGDPILFNFLRYGFPLYDSGFIKPTQRLLQSGRITPSEEAIRLYSKIAPKNIEKAESFLKAAVIKFYDAMTASAQAVSMVVFNTQPEPREIPDILKKLVEEKNLDRKYVRQYQEIFKLWKDIDHQKIKDVSGKIIEKQERNAKDFVNVMNSFLKKFSKD